MPWVRSPLVGVLVALALAGSASAAPSCAKIGEPLSVELIAAHPTATEEVTATREEIDRIAARIGVTPNVRSVHPLMLIVAEGGTHVEITHRLIERLDAQGAAYVCDVPDAVQVLIGAFKRRVILHREAAANPCIRQALLDHMAQHSRLLDAHIDLFVDDHRDELARDIQQLTEAAGPDKARATHAFETGVAALVGPLYRDFEREVERSRLDADTPEALDQLGRVCGGKLRELESEISGPDHRRVSL